MVFWCTHCILMRFRAPCVYVITVYGLVQLINAKRRNTHTNLVPTVFKQFLYLPSPHNIHVSMYFVHRFSGYIIVNLVCVSISIWTRHFRRMKIKIVSQISTIRSQISVNFTHKRNIVYTFNTFIYQLGWSHYLNEIQIRSLTTHTEAYIICIICIIWHV